MKITSAVLQSIFKNKIFSGLWKAVSLFLCMLFCSSAMAATLESEVDRETVIEGESVVLYITGTGLGSLPDTSPLLKNFIIVQSGVSSSDSIVNGQRTRGFKIRLELQAKKTGKMAIPALTVDGVSSDSLVVEVVARGTPGVEPRDNAFVELSVDTETPYVQAQVILTLKIFDDGKLQSASPIVEGNSDIQVERLPRSGEQLEERNGERYRVNTFKYALFPQKSGEITFDSIVVPATVSDKSFGGGLILRNTPTRRIELRTEPLTLNVKPRAAANTSAWWLPVKALELKHEWSEDIKTGKPGEPFTLSFELAALGASSTQLPEIPVPNVPGLKIYTDTPQFASRPEQDNVVSVRREKWSVIPNKSGVLTLPEIVIKWWDTTEDIEKRVVFPAQELSISSEGLAQETPAPGNIPDADLANSNVMSDNSDASGDQASDVQAESQSTIAQSTIESAIVPADAVPLADTAQVQGVDSNHLWQWLAFATMAAWLATLIAWWACSRKTPANENLAVVVTNESADWKRVQKLSRGQNTEAYGAAVIQWAQSRWPDAPVHNLPEVGVRLGSQQLSATMRQLDQYRYAGHEYTTQQAGATSLIEIQSQLESAINNEKRQQYDVPAHSLPQL